MTVRMVAWYNHIYTECYYPRQRVAPQNKIKCNNSKKQQQTNKQIKNTTKTIIINNSAIIYM